jgi:ABC-type uncharacterized transport system YnjBCD permease subunit
MLKKSAKKLGIEMRIAIAGFLVTAFGFLAALVWRDVIQSYISKLIEDFGIRESIVYYQLISAVLITIICALGVALIGKYAEKR